MINSELKSIYVSDTINIIWSVFTYSNSQTQYHHPHYKTWWGFPHKTICVIITTHNTSLFVLDPPVAVGHVDVLFSKITTLGIPPYIGFIRIEIWYLWEL